MIFKAGIDVMGIRPELVLVLVVVDGVYRARGLELRITSVTEGKHGTASLHYAGQAADCGTKEHGPREEDFADRVGWVTEREAFLVDLFGAIDKALGYTPDVDVSPENAGGAQEHIHVEVQPKRRSTS